ncbi:MAG: sugar transferase [Chloroflexota bacterium]|nr:sugar transferase [Chloroflexota bacterium]
MVSRTRRLSALLYLADIAIALASLYISDLLRHELPFGFGDSVNLGWVDWQQYVAVALIWAFILQFFRVYEPRRIFTAVEEIRVLLPAVTIAFVALLAYLFIFKIEFLSRLLIAYFYGVNLILLVNLRWILRLFLRSTIGFRRRLVIMGAGPVGEQVAGLLQQRPWTGYDIVGFLDDDPAKQGVTVTDLPVLGTCDHLGEMIGCENVAEVIVALPAHAHERIREVVTHAGDYAVSIRVVPDIFSMISVRARAEDLWGIPLIGIREPVITGFDSFVKRTFDIVVGSISLIVSAPLMLAVTFAILIDDGWPVFFSQRRVGENGRLFWIYKLRTMDKGHSRRGVLSHRPGPDVRQGDPRVTRVGRFLRRTSLDELPNLWNVLRGEMSLVGPRPELPWVVEEYEPWQRQRLSVQPGMTGWWQIQGRGEAPLRDNVELDLYYIQNYSPVLDLMILWRTIWVVLSGRGAY